MSSDQRSSGEPCTALDARSMPEDPGEIQRDPSVGERTAQTTESGAVARESPVERPDTPHRGTVARGTSAPGAIALASEPVTILAGRPTVVVEVVNVADRPVQVGSHYHFAEVNPALHFDRDAAWGRRLAVPAGTSVRFEPGIERTVALVALGGRRVVPGLRRAVGGALEPRDVPDAPGREEGS